MKDTKQTGDVSTAMILAALLRAGKNVLIPFGDRNKYDLVIEDSGKFIRIQCKTGRTDLYGSIKFNLYSVVRDPIRKKFVKKPYLETVDAYGIYYPVNNTCYLVPSKDLGTGEAHLRLTVGKREARMADDFLIND